MIIFNINFERTIAKTRQKGSLNARAYVGFNITFFSEIC